MTEVRIWCDRCGAVIAAPQEEMGEALDDNGWTADDFGDFTCGNCRRGLAEAAIARVRDVCDLWQRRHDTYIRRPDDIPAIPITAVLRALEGAE